MSPSYPVAWPKLPEADLIAPYLRRVDENRYYSNFGPLVSELEVRLAERYGVPAGGVTTVANATSGLIGALAATTKSRSRNVNDGPAFCLLPAWTFVASLHAVLAVGMEPYLVDVDETSWQITPELAEEALDRVPGEPVAVMPVSPFGRPVDMAAWDAFAERTGLIVVVDAAAAFDKGGAGVSPSVVSLHATKVLAAGEGGFVVSEDTDTIDEIRKTINFGFAGSRVALSRAINGKMSEYHAAVALAALDVWPQTRQVFADIADAYRQAMHGDNQLSLLPGETDDHVSSTVLLIHEHTLSEEFDRRLEALGVQNRRWWGGGAHRQIAYRRFSRDPLPTTASLARRSIGLPCYPGLGGTDIEDIRRRVLLALDQA